MGVIPSAYRRVEYLENSGTQYILTNYVPTTSENMVITLDTMQINHTGDNMFFGERTVPQKYQYYLDDYSGRLYGANGFKKGSVVGAVTLGKRRTYRMQGDSLLVDGVVAGSLNTTNLEEGQHIEMAIFAWNNNGTADYINHQCRIYRLTFAVDGVPEADFVPCVRISDSEPGMYDTVSGTFYTNAGTGEFVVGPDVIETEVSEWLMTRRRGLMVQEHGPNYIKDGLIAWFDGINYGGDPTKWVDLINGVEFTATTNTSRIANGWQLTGGKNQGLTGTQLSTSAFTETLEITFSSDRQWRTLLFGNGTGIVFYATTAGIYYIGGGSTQRDMAFTDITSATDCNGANCVSLNKDNFIVNGVAHNTRGENNWWNNVLPVMIGARANSDTNYFVGNIYALRIYNRHLTTAEMLHNQRIDNARFNLGLTI